MRSFLNIHDMASGQSRCILTHEARIEAPSWAPAGPWAGSLVVQSGGRLHRVPMDAPRLIEIPTLEGRHNNDQGFTRDGSALIFGAHRGLGAEIWRMALPGGTPELVSPQAPSWWHGQSPDGAWIAYAAARGDRVIDVYRMPAAGGPETRLTGGEGQCDGPDVSADGRRIYYNCDRSGRAQIWVMGSDGSDPRLLFQDDHVNWFPHPSPDGRHLVYLAYPPGTEGHPYDLPVALCLCDPDGGNRRRILEFTGGQGTINVPSWAPDGSAFAWVSYG